MSLLGLLTRLVVVSRRSFAGLLGYVVLLGVLYAVPGPLPEAYVPTAAVLVVIVAWLVVAGVAGVTDDRSTAHLLAAAARGPARLHVLLTGAGVVSALPLIALSIIGGLLLAESPRGPDVVIAGFAAHVAAALVGAGLGAIAARPVVGEPALAPAIVIAGFILVIVVSASSPVGPALHLLQSTGDASPPGVGEVAGRSVLWIVLAAGWAVILTSAGARIAAHRRAYGTNAAA